MEDAEYDERLSRYQAHMSRFREAHSNMPELQRDILIDLERKERWARIMGADIAAVVPAP